MLPPKDFQVLFLDMNSFFASVEQQVRPILRGKSVGVAPYTGDTGCIIAASREAKTRGVSIGRISEAKKLCPGIIIVESRPALYMIYHEEIKKVIESFGPFYTPLSIDEFVIRLTPREKNYQNSIKLAQNLKQAIKERIGEHLTCSIGIGPSRFLAKMAGERRKPNGLTVVQLSELKKFYSELKLLDITGINYRTEALLNFSGIHSPLSLFNLSLPELRMILKHPGRLWYFRLRGYEVDDFVTKSKTIGHSHVLPPEYRSKNGALSVIRKLIFKAGFRLRKEGYWACGVSAAISFFNDSGFHKSKRVEQFCDSNSFIRNILELLRNCPWRGKPVYVSISAFNLVRPMGGQISIINEVEKAKKLSKTLDLVNDQFGAMTLFPASLFEAKESAPDRISFGRPRYGIIH